MTEPFERENRYFILKYSDLDSLTADDVEALNRVSAKALLSRKLAGKSTSMDSVVVEADWPEYETVWKMIEDRMTGKTPQDSYKIKNHSVAVATDYYWQPMETCPRGVKVQLLGAGGVATYGQHHGDKFWLGWAPLPQKPENLKCLKNTS